MLGVSPVAGAVLAAKYWPNDGVTLRARRRRPRRWLGRTVVEASVQSVAISIASPLTMRASSISACTVVAARRRTSPSLISEQQSRPPMSATKALTRSRKRRAEAERPSRPGNRSLWFVTAERVREGNSSEGDDMASIPARSRDIPELMLITNISLTGQINRAVQRRGRITVLGAIPRGGAADGDCPNNGGRRHRRQMRFCHDYSSLSRATDPNRLDLGTLRLHGRNCSF